MKCCDCGNEIKGKKYLVKDLTPEYGGDWIVCQKCCDARNGESCSEVVE